MLTVLFLNIEFLSAHRIDRLENFSQFHSSNKHALTKLGQLNSLNNAENPSHESRADEKIGEVLARIANYKQFKDTNEKGELWWIYSNMLI